MRAVFIAFFLFLFAQVFSQDGYNQPAEHYSHIKQWTENLSAQETRDFSDFLVGQTPYRLSFLKSVITDRGITYAYTFEEKTITRGDAKLITVEFVEVSNSYSFRSFKVHSETADALYVWTRVFLPTATWDLINNNYKYSDLIGVDQKVWIRLLNGNEIRKFEKK